MRRNLPVITPGPLVLDVCPESFSAMTPVARGRHCHECNRTVVDMTHMTRAEAEALFVREQEQLCGYVLANDAGDTFFAEPTAPRSSRLLATGLAAAMLVSGCGAAPSEDTAAPDATYQWPDSSPPLVSTTVPTVSSAPWDTPTARPTPTTPTTAGAGPTLPIPRAGGLRRR